MILSNDVFRFIFISTANFKIQSVANLPFCKHPIKLIEPTFMNTSFEDHLFLSTDDGFFD